MKTNNADKMVVIEDHFDSFTYNLVALLQKLGAKVKVIRTDQSIESVKKENPTHILLSPGPGHPKEVALFQDTLRVFKGRIPILGVCLGHQAIGLHFGAVVDKCPVMMHGKQSAIIHNHKGVFRSIPINPFVVCRYHSLGIVAESIPKGVLMQSAWSEDGTIMAIQSVEYPSVVGVQFHPESLFTDYGAEMLQSFLSMS